MKCVWVLTVEKESPFPIHWFPQSLPSSISLSNLPALVHSIRQVMLPPWVTSPQSKPHLLRPCPDSLIRQRSRLAHIVAEWPSERRVSPERVAQAVMEGSKKGSESATHTHKHTHNGNSQIVNLGYGVRLSSSRALALHVWGPGFYFCHSMVSRAQVCVPKTNQQTTNKNRGKRDNTRAFWADYPGSILGIPYGLSRTKLRDTWAQSQD